MSSEADARTLADARLLWWEEPAKAIGIGERLQHRAQALGDEVLRTRALVLQASALAHRGDLQDAFARAYEADRYEGGDHHARAEISGLFAHLHFFNGGYEQSLARADDAVREADATDDLTLRLHARRMACLPVANLGVPDLLERFEDTLTLAVQLRSPWEEAICRNDVANFRMIEGDYPLANAQLDAALDALRLVAGPSRFLRSVLQCTLAELRLQEGRAGEALDHATLAVSFSMERDEANPYLLGACLLVRVQALVALGERAEAEEAAAEALGRLGNRVPQLRELIESAIS